MPQPDPANVALLHEAIGRQVDLQRYSLSVVRRILALMNRADDDLIDRLIAALLREQPSMLTVERLDALLASVRGIQQAASAEAQRQLEQALRGLAQHEVEYQQDSIQSAMPTEIRAALSVAPVSAEQAYAAAMARPFQGVLLREALAGVDAAKARAIRDAIRIGFAEQETIDQMVRRIRGTRAASYADGLLERSRRDIEALVRTAVNHTADVARQELFRANPRLVKRWQFVATLDGRTTINCMALNGKSFPVGEGPRPPRHWNCRSCAVPVLASWRELGIMAAETSPGTRASMDGQVAADISFSDWLKSKPIAFQDDLLGPARARLFRDGSLTVDRFADAKGRPLTLAQLRAKYPRAFERAKV